MGGRRRVFQIALLVVSTALGVALFEASARLVFHPVDYLLPDTVSDPELNHRIAGHSGGHDAWGFRNYALPDRAEIVAIGDSQTYGIAALSRESWPAVLGQQLEVDVYNMGLGGYGPLQYLYLLRQRALTLEPRTIVVGLYFGNDFMDVINLAYTNDYWADYRVPELPRAEGSGGFEISIPGGGPGRIGGGLRNALAKNSVAYRVLSQSPLLDRFRARGYGRPTALPVALSGGLPETTLDPTVRSQLVDVHDPQIVAALQITTRALREMKATCDARGVDLHVLLIPTKELVHAPLLAAPSEPMARLVALETALKGQLMAIVARDGIPVIDPLSALQRAASEGPIFPVSDSHPNAAGYAVIASRVAAHLEAPATPEPATPPSVLARPPQPR